MTLFFAVYGMYLLIGALGAAILWAKGFYWFPDFGAVIFVALCVTMWPFVVFLYVLERLR